MFTWLPDKSSVIVVVEATKGTTMYIITITRLRINLAPCFPISWLMIHALLNIYEFGFASHGYYFKCIFYKSKLIHEKLIKLKQPKSLCR